jgi:hypothetical protein
MKFGNEFWLILFQEYISPNLFAVWAGIITTYMHKLFPHRESLVRDIPAGDGNIEKLFYGVCLQTGTGFTTIALSHKQFMGERGLELYTMYSTFCISADDFQFPSNRFFLLK